MGISKMESLMVKDNTKIIRFSILTKDYGVMDSKKARASRRLSSRIMKDNLRKIKRMVKEHLFFTFQPSNNDKD